MGKVILQNKAQDALQYMQKYEPNIFEDIVLHLKSLQSIGWTWNKLKDIGNGIKRIRVGRWRILCTYKDDIFVWIIALEKDTDKDYQRWKSYILQQIK